MSDDLMIQKKADVANSFFSVKDELHRLLAELWQIEDSCSYAYFVRQRLLTVSSLFDDEVFLPYMRFYRDDEEV